jgi:hypothetical protein
MRAFEAPERLPGTPPYNPPQAGTRNRARTTNTSHRLQIDRSRLVSPMRELERDLLPTPMSDAWRGATVSDRHLEALPGDEVIP